MTSPPRLRIRGLSRPASSRQAPICLLSEIEYLDSHQSRIACVTLDRPAPRVPTVRALRVGAVDAMRPRTASRDLELRPAGEEAGCFHRGRRLPAFETRHWGLRSACTGSVLGMVPLTPRPNAGRPTHVSTAFGARGRGGWPSFRGTATPTASHPHPRSETTEPA